MEKERKTQSASSDKKTVSGSTGKQGHISGSNSADNRSARQGKKEPAKSSSSDAGNEGRKETKKQYVNKPSPTRKVTVSSNQKLGKDGKVNSGNQSGKAKTKDKKSAETDRKEKGEKTASKENTKKEKKKKKTKAKTTAKRSKSAVFPTFLLFILSIVLIAATVALCIPLIRLPKKGKNISLQYDLYGEKSRKTVSADQILRDGKNVYVCLNDFSDQVGLRILGNEENAIIYTDNGDSVSIENGSYRVLINRVSLELPGNVIIEGKNIYVPAALLFDYADGLEITYNSSTGKMNISTVKDDERSTSITTVYKDIVFTPHEVAPHTPLAPG